MVLRSGSVKSNSIGPPLYGSAPFTAAQSVVPAFVCVHSRRFVQPFREHPDCFVFVPGQANHQLTRYTPGAVNVNAAVDVDKHVAPVLANLSQYGDGLELSGTHYPENSDLMHPSHVALPYRPNTGSPHKRNLQQSVPATHLTARLPHNQPIDSGFLSTDAAIRTIYFLPNTYHAGHGGREAAEKTFENIRK